MIIKALRIYSLFHSHYKVAGRGCFSEAISKILSEESLKECDSGGGVDEVIFPQPLE